MVLNPDIVSKLFAGVPEKYISKSDYTLDEGAIAASARPFSAVVSAVHCANSGNGETCDYKDGTICPLFRAIRPMILEQFYLLISCFGSFVIYTLPNLHGRRILIYEGLAMIDRVDGDGNVTRVQFGYAEVADATEDFVVRFKLPEFVVEPSVLA